MLKTIESQQTEVLVQMVVEEHRESNSLSFYLPIEVLPVRLNDILSIEGSASLIEQILLIVSSDSSHERYPFNWSSAGSIERYPFN